MPRTIPAPPAAERRYARIETWRLHHHDEKLAGLVPQLQGLGHTELAEQLQAVHSDVKAELAHRAVGGR